MKNKNLLLITVLSILACVAHGVMLFTPFNDYIFTSLAKLVIFVACSIIYFALTKDGRFVDLFSVKGRGKALKYSALFGLGSAIVVFIAFLIIRPWLEQEMVVNALSNVGITSENYIFAVMYYVVVNVALEELFFRGFIFLTLYRIGYKVYAHIFSATLFAVYHVAIMRYGVDPALLVLATVGLTATGIFFNEITRRSDSIIGSYLVHASASLAISIIGFNFIN
ncbi:MAG: CPBP family intramembrane metalloprotease [Defluviitaleaceae bacterium]|nr:CPBP family intramembrane metalloprotease [Defluviitaleaceae bacterium]